MKLLLSIIVLMSLIVPAFANSMPDCRSMNQEEMRARFSKVLEESAYSPEVKEKLKALHQKYSDERRGYMQDIRDLRQSIGEKLFDPNISAKEISKLKKEFKKLEEKRVEAGFKSLDEALKLLKPSNANSGKDLEIQKSLFHLFNHSDY